MWTDVAYSHGLSFTSDEIERDTRLYERQTKKKEKKKKMKANDRNPRASLTR